MKTANSGTYQHKNAYLPNPVDMIDMDSIKFTSGSYTHANYIFKVRTAAPNRSGYSPT